MTDRLLFIIKGDEHRRGLKMLLAFVWRGGLYQGSTSPKVRRYEQYQYRYIDMKMPACLRLDY